MVTRKNTSITLTSVSAAAGAPLYQQVMDGIKREIRAGRLRPGTLLPSFRALAGELMVSIITVKRAYEDLETEGVVYCKQGVGTFVAEDGLLRNRAEQHRQALELLHNALRQLLATGVSEQELIETVKELLKQIKRESEL